MLKRFLTAARTRTADHARATDLPGFSRVPRVQDVATEPGAWGRIASCEVRQDHNGRLWVRNDAIMKHRDMAGTYGSVVAWSRRGLALYMPKSDYDSISTTHITPALADCYVPVARILPTPPLQASAS